MSQNGQELRHLWCHSQKIRNPKPKQIFFIANEKTCQVFEGLNSSLMLSALKIFPCKGTCKLLVLGRKL